MAAIWAVNPVLAEDSCVVRIFINVEPEYATTLRTLGGDYCWFRFFAVFKYFNHNIHI